VVRALHNQLIIPDWQRFIHQIGEVFHKCKDLNGGKASLLSIVVSVLSLSHHSVLS
jgi:hypothetical protein